MSSVKKIQEQLTKNLLVPILLDLLDNKPMCGYEIMSAIKKTYGVKFGASTMYPALNNLESRDFVVSEWNIDKRRPKKIYKLTREGQNALNYSVGALSQICRTLDNVNAKSHKNIQIGVLVG
jgi:DNA-binding PadR family transcriptional regulator